jgi:phosphatidylethanolamine-binding protein (PEBP) family uncharacterized protein
MVSCRVPMVSTGTVSSLSTTWTHPRAAASGTASVTELKPGAGDLGKNLTPAGAVQSNTDFGQPGYVGAAPTPGPAHRYLITWP